MTDEERRKAHKFVEEMDKQGYAMTCDGREKYIVDNVFRVIQTQQEEIEILKQEKATAWEEWNIINEYCEQEKQKYKTELEKKEALIHTMQAEFERLENLEDNTDMLKEELKKKDKIINNSINEIEKLRQYFSEDLQVEFIRILEILKDKKVIDW